MHAEPQYLTVDEFAVRLRVSKRTIFRLIAAGLPSILVGGSRRVVLRVGRGLAVAPQRAMVDAEERAMSASQLELERDIGIGVARAEAEIYAAESCMAMADSRVRALGATVARLRALAVQVGLLRPEPIVHTPPAPPIDELTRAKARRALARSGFVKVTP